MNSDATGHMPRKQPRRRKKGRNGGRRSQREINRMAINASRLLASREIKHTDIIINPTNIVNVSLTLPEDLNLVSQGAGNSQRIGHDIKILRMSYRIQIRYDLQGDDQFYTRFMFFREFAPQGSFSTIENFLQNAASNTAIVSPYNYGATSPFRIYDDTVLTSTLMAGDTAKYIKGEVSFGRGVNVDYKNTSDEVTNIQKNGFGFWIFSDSGSPNFLPVYNMYIRMYYSDL